MTTRTAGFAAAEAHVPPSDTGAPFESRRSRRWAALLDRVAEGDLDACGDFYDESSQLTFSLLMQAVQDRDTAEDLMVDLYLDIRNRAQRGEHRHRNPLSWVIERAQRAAVSRPVPRLSPAPRAPQRPTPNYQLPTPHAPEQHSVWELGIGSWRFLLGGLVARIDVSSSP